jgi:diadenosine tetraphosphate (Ap4A) HIT family hydrolase
MAGSLRLLLHKDAHVRWFILVPETDATEWHELPGGLRDQTPHRVVPLGAMLKGEEGCDKINIAAIGNLVPQFHFHVIGRWRSDPYWPGVVWGRSLPGQAYEIAEVRRLQENQAMACLAACKEA